MKISFLAIALTCVATAMAGAQEYKSANAAYDAYRRIYEQNDSSALAVYSEEGVMRFLDDKEPEIQGDPAGNVQNFHSVHDSRR